MKGLFDNVPGRRNVYLMVLADAGLVAGALGLAFLLRFDGRVPDNYLALFVRTLPFVVVMKLAVFYFFGLYRGMWRYTSLADLKHVVIAATVSSLLLAAYVIFFHTLLRYPRSVILIDYTLTFVFVGGIRVAVRMALSEGGGLLQGVSAIGGEGARKVLIIGAGAAGEKAVREMMDNRSLRMRPVGFLDDDPSKRGKSIHGVPVLGGVDSIGAHEVLCDEIMIALPSATGDEVRRIVALCETTGRRFMITPSLGEIMNGRVSVTAVRKVRYEDLLGREVVRLEAELLSETYRGKRILVTGAGGSIGSELVLQVAGFRPAALGLLDSSEFNLFEVEMHIRQRFEFIPVSTFLVDIRDEVNLRRVVREFRPDVIFHAAALKHVPMQELNPWEAVLTNVRGTRNLLEAVRETAPERFVLVSTDKAVRPTNVMGATKRVAELMVECAGGDKGGSGGGDDGAARFVAVRFGNVLGSSGSVIPLFMRQIKNRLPLTVTHPDVTRYFMSVSEATQLILQAGAMGEGGELFILDMGKPVRIADMARDLIRLQGLEPDKDIPIRFVGLRPGEKLYEELITEGEGIVATRHEKIRVIRGRHGDYEALSGQIDELIRLAGSYDADLIRQKLKELVPEYTPGEGTEEER